MISARCCFFALSRGLRTDCIRRQIPAVAGLRVLYGASEVGSPGCIVAVAAAPAAFAADMPLPGPAPAYAQPPPALYHWSGIYIGVHVGAGLLEDSVTTTTSTAAVPFQNAGVQTNLSPFGVIGGGQAGINFQFSSIVIGAEGTWTDSGISGSQATSTLLTPLLGTSVKSTDAPPWYATATGRIGYAANDVLIYAKGGAAWMNADYTQTVFTPAGVVSSHSSPTPATATPWAAGSNTPLPKICRSNSNTFISNFGTEDLQLQQPQHYTRAAGWKRFRWRSSRAPICSCLARITASTGVAARPSTEVPLRRHSKGRLDAGPCHWWVPSS